MDKTHWAKGEIHIQIYEQYFSRVSCYVGLTAVISDERGEVTVALVGSDHGFGPFHSWGDNGDFVIRAADVLRNIDFKTIS